MATIYGNALANTLKGTAYADLLYGYASNDVLYGYGGNDTLDGGTGGDRMYGGSGNDTYIVDNASDYVYEAASSGIDTVRTSLGYYTLPAHVENLSTTNALGTAPVILAGNALNNVITGNNGANVIHGHGGADTIYGGGGDDMLGGNDGADRLTGGAGRDIFMFDLWGARDTITDFVSGTDKIDMTYFATQSQFRFIGTASFSGRAGEGRFSNGLFQFDYNGDRVSDIDVTVIGQVRAGDFQWTALGYWDY